MDQLATASADPAVTVRIRGVIGIPAVLESLGSDPVQVFSRAKVDLALFDDPDQLISLAAVGRLMQQCIASTGCEHFGLLVGERGGQSSLGLIGLAVRDSPDVEVALRRLGTHLHLYYGGQVMNLDVSDDVATLSYAIHQPGVEAVDQIEDGALAIFCNIMRDLCGPNWLPLEVRFAHRRPASLRPFLERFHTTLRFNAEQSALIFSTNWLRRRLPEVDADLRRLLERAMDELQATQGTGFVERVRGVLRTALVTGHGSADQVAALFSMHRRTLSRRMAECGTSFAALADESRFEIAKHMLANTTMDVSQIAAALDYAEASAFTRAFRRWSGTTPASWRAKRRRARK
jgi:AraC-like DNA-binding protein